ncbi:DNA (cytosine-5-)-methyltransferase [Helicobacter saguini]|uniref:Cytosine-specific methyltransferase n=1 Tax=Helicobacter saguini TaxID=1548018 RepID=A0A347VMS9_9HELI|nr:DNA (cytosine-5-)-methyltransferase [Helicobacter saguini]MWV67700.1 DNA (cytosine-5-)-methyltransferase [Helicobacter saguini]MWV70052.1 DNA (cytosine-5-)-methyltransferase [Helicobacter saguini]MWV72735.1 DNA (cytosine-5-)-methyltransferase [Helicobacter saguini]TLD91389.1 DNA (cytosine-5-)-methyltransferase [Helicobacter saguini]
MTFLDFCAGIGGGRLGLELNDFKCVGFSEIDKEAIRTYKSFFDTKNELELGDLTKLDSKNLPNFDLLISGFPCQTFSIVGKREGLKDSNKGQIIFHLSKILQEKQPKYFILENVKGLINHNKGATLRTILELLQSCNYNVSYKLLNSLDFNLPQSRERIYFVGIRKDLESRFYFDTQILQDSNFANIKDFLSPNNENLFRKNTESYNTFLRYIENKYNKNRVNLEQILSQDFLVIDTRQSDLRIYKNKIPTLRRDRQGLLYVYNKELYKLSGLEALKLQGFYKLDNLEQKIINLKTSDILRQCGNAMSVNVIESIAGNIFYTKNEKVANG